MLPKEADWLDVNDIYFGKRVPSGYHRRQLPLANVTYYMGVEKVSNVIVSYDEAKLRFPKQFCRYFIERTILVPSK